MAKNVGVIRIPIQAGTAEFLVSLDKANAKIVQFGNKIHEANSRAVSETKATAAAFKIFEGNLTGNSRAVDAFAENILGLGGVFQKLFPIAGGIAFGATLVEIGNKAHEFFKEVRDGPEKVSGAFRLLNSGLRTTNDELRVTNDRLANDIAKLEGRAQNTLQVSLDEARAAADRLGESLEKDLGSLHKLLDENKTGLWRSLLTGEGRTDDIARRMGGETGFGGFTGEIAAKVETGRAQIGAAKTPEEAKRLAEELQRTLTAAFEEQIKSFETRLEALRKRSQPETTAGIIPGKPKTFTPTGDTKELEIVTAAVANLREQQQHVPLMVQNASLSARREDDQAAKDNREREKPFEDRMKALAAQIDGLKAKMEAIGRPESAQILATAFAESQKAIEEVNKALEKHNVKLTEAQKEEIRTAEKTLATTSAEAEWRKKFDASTVSINDRIAAQERLAAAIGAGFEATKNASVETKLAQELGPKANDQEWIKAHAGDVSTLRSGFERDFEAQHQTQIAETIEKLHEQIGVERDLAAVQAQGAEAVRQVTLAHKVAIIARDEDAASAKRLIAAELELYRVEQGNKSAEEISKINQKIESTNRLTTAILKGADAVRKAELENRVAEIRRAGDDALPAPELPGVGTTGGVSSIIQQISGMGPREIAARNEADADQKQGDAQAKAHTDRLQQINDEIARLQQAKAIYGDTLSLEIALRDLENQRLHVLVEQSLALGSAKDGVRAFFLEMQQDAMKTSQIIYNALNSAFDRVSENLTKAMTGQKTAWAAMFKGIGQEMLQNTIKSEMQKGLGSLGKLFGLDIGKIKPDGTRANPLWVRMDGATAGAGAGAGRNTSGLPAAPPIPAQTGGILGTGVHTTADIKFDADGIAINRGRYLDGLKWKASVLPSGLINRSSETINGIPPLGVPPSLSDLPLRKSTIGRFGGPDGSEGNPFYVVDESGKGKSSKSPASGFMGLLGPLLGGGGSAGAEGGGDSGSIEDVTSSISFPGMATGGPVRKGKTYMTGERGHELFVAPENGHIFNHQDTRRMASAAAALSKPFPHREFGGAVSAGQAYITGESGSELYRSASAGFEASVNNPERQRAIGAFGRQAVQYHVDARGTDAMTIDQNMRRALTAVHGNAVITSMRGNHDQTRRQPARSGQ